jgi:hypothetical protein
MFFISKSWAADEEIIALMARIAENVSVAIDNLDRASEKARTEAQRGRLARMLAALSATNEAISCMRTELFGGLRSCRKGGRFNSTSIMLAPDCDHPTCGRGADRRYRQVTFRRRPPGSGSTTHSALRACVPMTCVRTRAGLRSTIHSERWRDVRCAFPLQVEIRRRDAIWWTPYWVASYTTSRRQYRLRWRISTAPTTRQGPKIEERLTRMFAALSATNEAIMRAKSRTAVRSGVRSRSERRQVYLGYHRVGHSRQRPSQDRRRLGPGGRGDAARQVVGG